MSDKNQTLTPPKNLICNFRAPNDALFYRWKTYVKWCQDNGKDVCHTTLSLIDSFIASLEGASGSGSAQIVGTKQIINLQQQNTFHYEVSKYRREPNVLNCAKEEFQRTIRSSFADAYVLEKARGLKGDFCFRDFLELKHDSFRRIVLRLKREGKVVALPFRSNPQYYCLAERLNSGSENR
jgi:hypothetical protein